MKISSLLLQQIQKALLIAVKQVAQEIIRALCLNAVERNRTLRKIFEVESDDEIRTRGHRSRQHMSVFRSLG